MTDTKAKILFLAVSGLILWQILMPGYILTLDMPWSPHLEAQWSEVNLNNTYAVVATLSTLNKVLPSWVLQKLILMAIFFLLFYMPYRFFPKILNFLRFQGVNQIAIFFSAFLYALNPFVYSRFLAGQWMLLFGLALLPYVFSKFLDVSLEPDRKKTFSFALALIILSLFSIHLLYIFLLFSSIWIIVSALGLKKIQNLKFFILALTVFLAVSCAWIIPSIERPAKVESTFNTEHFKVFSAAANPPLGIIENVLFLGGFWGEGTVSKYYFLWPQQNIYALFSGAIFLILAIFGIILGLKRKESRFFAIVLAIFVIFFALTSLGASQTPFQKINLFLYHNMPFWNGLRDSQKISAFLVLFYCIFSAAAIDFLLRKVPKVLKEFFKVAIFIVPIFLSIYMWAGFHGQIKPVWYPNDWEIVKGKIDSTILPGQKILVLPWHGYLSLDFANNLVVANPAPNYFGNDITISSKNIEFGNVYDEETGTEYKEIDNLMQKSDSATEQNIKEILSKNYVRYLLVIKNNANQKDVSLQPRIESSKYFPLTIYEGESLVLKSTD